MSAQPRIAIVGLGGMFPGAATPEQLWRNILNRVDSSQEPPSGRWILEADRVHLPGEIRADHVPSRRACFLDPFTVEAEGLDLPRDLLHQLDPVFLLALEVSRRAWQSAVTSTLDRRRVGVILGAIALPTEKTSSLTRHVLGRALCRQLERPYPWSDEGMPHPLNVHVTGLPAGIVAQALQLGGCAFTLDAACASSLYAIKLAVDELRAGRADAMLAGGLSRPDSLYTQMGFAQLRALSPTGRCSPFDARGDGLVVGEGAGVFVLKRLEDARRDGDRIHGVIAGIGLSNDVDGGLLAPASEGQLRAMRAAYAEAGWQPDEVDLIECHATGTPIGDKVEFQSLSTLWGDYRGAPGRCVLGAVKSTVGHLLTGAGAAALTKALFALGEAILPPTANFEAAAPGIDLERSPFRVLRQAEAWPKTNERARRCAVSAFGFGGINAHLLIEEVEQASEERPSGERGIRRNPGAEVAPKAISDENSMNVAESSGSIPVMVVSAEAKLGKWKPEELLGIVEKPIAETPTRWWGIPAEGRSGYFLDEVSLPVERYRIPPREVEEMLPQQVLILDVAGQALEQAQLTNAERLRTGVYLGVSLDLNTTNFHLRWAFLEKDSSLAEVASPPLTANRTMGALASIAASRIARAFRLGGPSFTVSSAETSGLTALHLGVEALRRGEIDVALVGAVDLAGDVRAVQERADRGWTCDGAVALVLRREKGGLAVVEGVDLTHGARIRASEAGNIEELIGHVGAATGLASVYRAILSLKHRVLPTNGGSRAWITATPRAVQVSCAGADGSSGSVRLLEQPREDASDRPWPRREGFFVVEAASANELIDELDAFVAWLTEQPERSIDALVREWLRRWEPTWSGLAVVLLPRDRQELLELIGKARSHLQRQPERPFPAEPGRERLFYAPEPLGVTAEVALVYPGSGNDFPGMGREYGLFWPRVLEDQAQTNPNLERQFPATPGSVQERILAQVAVGSLITEVLRGPLGLRPEAAIGYSLGESSALFGFRVWGDREEMLRRMQASSLFTSDLTGRCDAARTAWGLDANARVDWRTAIVERSPEEVRAAIRPGERVYLQIINTRRECVIGGHRAAVEEVGRRLGCSLVAVPETTTMHCEVVRPVAEAYRALHVLPTQPPEGVRFYSAGLGRCYDVDSDTAAEAILAQALDTIDFPGVIEAAYRDGVRVFVEVGPGGSCSRMIGTILGERRHVARSVCVAGKDGLAALWRVAAQLTVERIPIDVEGLYGSCEVGEEVEERRVVVAVGRPSFQEGKSRVVSSVVPPSEAVAPPRSISHEVPSTTLVSAAVPPRMVEPVMHSPQARFGDGYLEQMKQTADVQEARAAAHAAYLRYDEVLRHTFAETVAVQGQLFDLILQGASVEPIETYSAPPARRSDVILDREQCFEFAVGSIARVLGSEFAEVDTFPTRVRLPDTPLMLVDRIVGLEGEPRSMSHGRVVTEHDIFADDWYLDNGVIPTCLAVESGQADLFLSGYLGIDFQTRGLAVYRLLDAVVTFHSGLPGPGKTIRYDIHIDRFFRQDETYLFRFRFVGTVDGEPLLTMTDGCAGFFTEKELAAGKGVVRTALQLRRRPGVEPDDRDQLPPQSTESYSEDQLDALRRGDLAACFGPLFAELPLREPMRLPGGRLRLVHRVSSLEPRGGQYSIGMIRGEADIHADDWFLTCHFVDDQVMPGTLMYECCLHTLRILLMRMGWVGEQETVVCEPVPGVASRLKCRGQVTSTTKVVTYEVTIKERGYSPEPYAICDALMYADGKAIVEITDMSLRMTGLTREAIAELWGTHREVRPSAPLYDRHHILAFATGKPSEAFGERYRAFDEERFIARLPAPPYSFLDRVTRVEAEPWVMVAGGTVEAEYDVPPGEWYFEAERAAIMPFAVLLEIPLQVCGWMSAYLGSALTTDQPLHYRNLGGTATLHRVVTPESGTLVSTIRCTRVAASGGMIIQDFELQVRDSRGIVYEGATTFGFFSAQALGQQIGIRDATLYVPNEAERSRGVAFDYPTEPPYPTPMLRMLDRIECLVLDGGPAGLGYIEGSKTVRSEEWFFAAHFYQDPVMPGSLGLESLLQLLGVVAMERWQPGARVRFEANLGSHRWTYRGQVIPRNRQVRVQAVVTACDDARRMLTASGYLSVDGLVIYRMEEFTLRVVQE